MRIPLPDWGQACEGLPSAKASKVRMCVQLSSRGSSTSVESGAARDPRAVIIESSASSRETCKCMMAAAALSVAPALAWVPAPRSYARICKISCYPRTVAHLRTPFESCQARLADH